MPLSPAAGKMDVALKTEVTKRTICKNVSQWSNLARGLRKERFATASIEGARNCWQRSQCGAVAIPAFWARPLADPPTPAASQPQLQAH